MFASYKIGDAEFISGDKSVNGIYLLRMRKHYRNKSRENGVARPKWPRFYTKMGTLKSDMTSYFNLGRNCASHAETNC